MKNNKTPINTQAVAYLRGHQQSQLDEQLTVIRERAEQDGATITRVYADLGACSSLYVNRDQMLADAAGDAIRMVYVCRFDRLTRKLDELSQIVRQLGDYGVGLVSVTQPLKLRLGGPEGRLLYSFMPALDGAAHRSRSTRRK